MPLGYQYYSGPQIAPQYMKNNEKMFAQTIFIYREKNKKNQTQLSMIVHTSFVIK